MVGVGSVERHCALVSCSRLSWLFSSVLAHAPVAEGWPQALAHVSSRGGAALCWFAVGCARSDQVTSPRAVRNALNKKSPSAGSRETAPRLVGVGRSASS